MTSPRPVPIWLHEDGGSGWKGDHAEELVEVQGHVNQKLAQLREILVILREIQEAMPRFKEWLKSLQRPGNQFNPEVYVRMGAIAVWLRGKLGELADAGAGGMAAAPGSTGVVAAPVDETGGSTLTTDQAAHAYSAAQLMDAASGLGGVTNPFDWAYQFGFSREDLDKGYVRVVGGELFSLVTSPFETYHRHTFTHEAFDQIDDFMEEHGDEMDTMAQSVRDGLGALDTITNALDRAGVDQDSSALGGGIGDLESVLDDHQEVYDDAGGSGVPSDGPPQESLDDFLDRINAEMPIDGDSGAWDTSWSGTTGAGP